MKFSLAITGAEKMIDLNDLDICMPPNTWQGALCLDK